MDRTWSLLWLGGMLLILSARGIDVLVLNRRRRMRSSDGRRDIRCFAAGVLLSGAMWGLFPILFFHSMTELDRTYAATILSGMAGGSATILAAAQFVVWGYCAAVLLPASTMFLIQEGTRQYVTWNTRYRVLLRHGFCIAADAPAQSLIPLI